jgi:hypothetical protein
MTGYSRTPPANGAPAGGNLAGVVDVSSSVSTRSVDGLLYSSRTRTVSMKGTPFST